MEREAYITIMLGLRFAIHALGEDDDRDCSPLLAAIQALQREAKRELLQAKGVAYRDGVPVLVPPGNETKWGSALYRLIPK